MSLLTVRTNHTSARDFVTTAKYFFRRRIGVTNQVSWNRRPSKTDGLVKVRALRLLFIRLLIFCVFYFSPLPLSRARQTPSSSLNASGSQAGVVGGEAPNGNGFGGRYQDFGGARFHEVVLERSRGSASRGGTRRVPSSGLDVEAACPCSEDDRELPDEGSFRQQAHKGGMGDGHRRDAHTAEVCLKSVCVLRVLCSHWVAHNRAIRPVAVVNRGFSCLVPPNE